jgi:hypothetical protein
MAVVADRAPPTYAHLARVAWRSDEDPQGLQQTRTAEHLSRNTPGMYHGARGRGSGCAWYL